MTDALPRLGPPDPMNAEQAQAADFLLRSRGHLRGPLGCWLNSPKLAESAGRLGDFLRFHCSLPEDLKEIAILVAAVHWNGQHAMRVHAELAEKAGVDAKAIVAIAAGRQPQLEGAHGAVHDFAKSLITTGQIDDERYRRASAVLSDVQLVDLVGLIGYYSLVSLTLNAFRITSN